MNSLGHWSWKTTNRIYDRGVATELVLLFRVHYRDYASLLLFRLFLMVISPLFLFPLMEQLPQKHKTKEQKQRDEQKRQAAENEWANKECVFTTLWLLPIGFEATTVAHTTIINTVQHSTDELIRLRRGSNPIPFLIPLYLPSPSSCCFCDGAKLNQSVRQKGANFLSGRGAEFRDQHVNYWK